MENQTLQPQDQSVNTTVGQPDLQVSEPSSQNGGNTQKTILLILLLTLAGLIVGFSGVWIYKTYLYAPSEVSDAGSAPVAEDDPTKLWKNYISETGKFRFKYPQNQAALSVSYNLTPIKADEELVVTVIGNSDQYLSLFLYKSDKNASDWWATEGKLKFEQLAVEVGRDETDPPVTINLTFEENNITFSGKDALNVIISSDYDSPNTPSKRYMTIVQNNGFIIATSYRDLGILPPSIEVSRQILSTLTFFDQLPSETPDPLPTQNPALLPST